MKYIHYLYIVPFALLTACNSEDQTSVTENSGKEPIVLSAGIVEGGHSAVTRATTESGGHDKHLVLDQNTKLIIRARGVWRGKSHEYIVKNTTATIDTETSPDSKHNSITDYNPVLYWDDYGTADPANKGDAAKGREIGLTLYSVAINGKTTIPTDLNTLSMDSTLAKWKAFDWTLTTDQSASGSTPADKDLLISNNVSSATEEESNHIDCGTYKFDERSDGKLLVFKHAMSKITVNLKAGAGFTNSAFASDPIVTLTSATSTEWAYTTGTVDVTTGSISNKGSLSAITMNQLATPTANYTVTKEALVIPGSEFKSHTDTIIKINADGNIYYVSAAKIRKAIDSSNYTNGNSFPTLAGKNYIINVTVNKTAIDKITATVADWTTVNSEDVSPKIKIDVDYGTTSGGTNFNRNEFSFYRSTSLDNGYSSEPNTLKVGNYYGEETFLKRNDSSSPWSMDTQLYWPNHNIHYQFRGVWPRTNTGGTPTTPCVIDVVHDSKTYQVIQVSNVAYDDDTFPSDLQIGRPNVADTECTNTETGHTKTKLYSGGICATEGSINLAFEYMMSQVEVNLSTTTGSDAVELTNAVVEIVNVYSTGDVKLGDRGVIPTGSTGSYILNNVLGDGNANKRLSAIVPQDLTYDTNNPSSNVKFKITITNTNSTPSDTSDDTKDVYYCDINPILKSGTTPNEKVAPNGKWENGVHYVYNLKLSKTKVNVTATLAEWTTVNANQDVWF